MSFSQALGMRLGKVKLTPRQLEVLTVMLEGLTGKEIANRLNISLKMTKVHKTAIYQKFKVDGHGALLNKIGEFKVTIVWQPKYES